MISIESLLSFLSISFLLAVSPGPSNAFLMAQTFTKGKQAGMQTAYGFAIAGVIHTIFAVLGLSAILKTSPTAYQIVQWCGAAYLVYLGILAIKDSFHSTSCDDKPHVSTKKEKNVLFQAMMTEVLNPKVALFFIAFLPQFVDTSLSLSATWQLAIFGLLYPIFAFPIDMLYVHFGDKIAGYFRHHPSAQQWLDRITGIIFITLAINLLL